jgi:hypothetical protein
MEGTNQLPSIVIAANQDELEQAAHVDNHI